MRRWLPFLLLSAVAAAQTPQTPRQALLEILKAGTPEVLDRHTPDVLLQELKKLPPEVRQKQQQSMMFVSMFLMASPERVQTFETGPVFLAINNPADHSHIEVSVERDDLSGDVDTIEFGIHVTKDGKEQAMPFNPRILIDMKMEKGIWKLSRIGGSASLQLDDPKVAAQILKTIQEQQKGQGALAGVHTNTEDPNTARILGAVRQLNTAEVTYSATYPQIGFTCSLSDLGGSMAGKVPDEHGAQLINPGLESGIRSGYRFEISGCSGSPVRRYRVMATPVQKGAGKKTYCSDETAVIRSIEESGSAQCLTNGAPLH